MTAVQSIRTVLPLICAAALAAPASAQEFALEYGVDVTNNYLNKGLTQTDDGVAVQPYLDLLYGDFYVGTWWSNVSFDDVKDVEFDVYAGYAPVFGNTSLDIGYAQYLYRDDSEDYGEAYFKVAHEVSTGFNIGLEYLYEVFAKTDWLYAYGDSELPGGWVFSAGIGSDFGTMEFSEDVIAVDAGVYRDLSDNIGLDLRVSDSSIEGTRGLVMLSIFN